MTTLIWFDDDDPNATMGPCPQCGGPTRAYDTCHTYPSTQPDGTKRWMACLGCYSAARIDCKANDGDGCGWPGYEWGLNPGNPRAVDNEQHRPSWLKGECPL